MLFHPARGAALAFERPASLNRKRLVQVYRSASGCRRTRRRRGTIRRCPSTLFCQVGFYTGRRAFYFFDNVSFFVTFDDEVLKKKLLFDK